MDEKDLTPWFDGRIKPVRKGVYQQMSGGQLGYQKWDGNKWGPWFSTPAQAAYTSPGDYARIQNQNDNWRGLRKRGERERKYRRQEEQ